MSDFYGSIVNNLKQEAELLNVRLEEFRDIGNMNMYIATLKSLRETLDLIKKYDWQLMYSMYGVPEGESNKESLISHAMEIAVWEQNHEGQIRNHKKWTVLDDKGIYVNSNLRVNGTAIE